MSDKRMVKLVRGYVQNIDHLPRDLKDLGLIHRFAVVQDTYRPGDADPYIDMSLYETVVNTVYRVTDATGIDIQLEDKAEVESDLNDFKNRVRQITKAPNPEPFPRINLRQGMSAIAVIECVPWWRVGGKEPYHDSCTLSIFTRSDLSDRLERELRADLDQAGVTVESVVQGQDSPISQGILWWFRRRFWIG
jgi:hypothetical protein